MRWRLITVVALVCAAAAAIALWVLDPQFGHWLQVHTGTVNEPGVYYGFWSGFGSDLEEFGILGAAGGQFLLCHRHHPDYQGLKPTHELIQRLHYEHLERQAAMHGKPHEAHQRNG